MSSGTISLPAKAGHPACRTLREHTWKRRYHYTDGNLVEGFYEHALQCATQYDRMTGYFTADALALAARGVGRLIANKGRMRLVVGCTLNPPEIAAIEQGYDLRTKVMEKLAEVDLTPPDDAARQGLELLKWMIQHKFLEVKVAVPVDERRIPIQGQGLYHVKVGIIEDAKGNRLTFSGSLNETAGGWQSNCEEIKVYWNWADEATAEYAQLDRQAFEELWDGDPARVAAYDFTEALRQNLLRYLPESDKTPPSSAPLCPAGAPPYGLEPEEVRRIVWNWIALAPRMANGVAVGERTSAISAWPHQQRTFLEFLRQPSACRLLIADEVGLGKTITTGLILRQSWISGQAKRILILAPKAVLVQWQNELYEKFNLDVPIYDGSSLCWRPVHGREEGRQEPAGRDEWHKQPFVLVSSQLMRRSDRAPGLLQAAEWDLVVLDEAHHARRKGAGGKDRGPNTLLVLMRGLRCRAKSLLLLTATPMQVAPVEVWDLLDLLGLPTMWNDPGNFVRYFELIGAGNPSDVDLVFLAKMFRAGGVPSMEEVRRVLPNASEVGLEKVRNALAAEATIPLKRLDTEQRRLALEILRRFTPLRRFMARQTRSLLRKYYEAGKLGSPIAERDPRDIPLDLSAGERALYEAVEQYIGDTYNAASASKRTAVGFVMTIYRRRLASSFYALSCTLKDRLNRLNGGAPVSPERLEEDLGDDETGDDLRTAEDAESCLAEAGPVEAKEKDRIQELLKAIAQLSTDTKAVRLVELLRDAMADGYPSAIVFTGYTDTMDYLKEHLAAHFEHKNVGCYAGSGGQRRDLSGRWVTVPKEQIKRDLRSGKIDILVCTDAAGEGLNLQTCGVLVNYDLPWNPMKVEQRIGRIDRIGQKYPKIRVYNLAYKDTVEADVYFAIGSRIRLFEGVVGKLQPILSRLPKRIEEIALMRPEQQEEARRRFLDEIEQMEQEAKEAGLDIDAVAEMLEPPPMPKPSLTLEDLEHLMQDNAARVPQLVWEPLDAHTYQASLPGMRQAVRVAVSGEVFDDHTDTHTLFSYGGAFFERTLAESAGRMETETGLGVCWVDRSGAHPAIIVSTVDGLKRPDSLAELRACLRQVSSAVVPPDPGFERIV